jgi:hypothetical protein
MNRTFKGGELMNVTETLFVEQLLHETAIPVASATCWILRVKPPWAVQASVNSKVRLWGSFSRLEGSLPVGVIAVLKLSVFAEFTMSAAPADLLPCKVPVSASKLEEVVSKYARTTVLLLAIKVTVLLVVESHGFESLSS